MKTVVLKNAETNGLRSLKNLQFFNVPKFIYLELIALTLLKLALDFTWLLPNWVLVLLATEMFSAWGFLKEFGIIEMGKKYVELAQKSIQKVVNMIPRYQAKWFTN